ncbi:hypothetical protein HYC85_029455 [Camellia sinensis]|uniref:Uncharacterized protein n=1 Tax=Camellia sinensis TaxID=4442 RepID=A0A7J7G1Y9_CAMSI|nr:hypothetical protein HYC85_029455 [Camellia sinensis]
MQEPWCVWTEIPSSKVRTDLSGVCHDRTNSKIGLTPSRPDRGNFTSLGPE